jgi:hypothetical protein
MTLEIQRRPSQAQVFDLRIERTPRAVDDAIASADPEQEARVQKFRAAITVTRVAGEIADLVGRDRIFALVTLLRKLPAGTAPAELARAIEDVGPPAE